MENQLLITLGRNKLLKNADISKIDLRRIKGRLITIGEGEILFREGDNADIIYLVTSGEINLLKKRLLGKTKSYIFSENEFFGHEEFFEETSRTSTAVALRDSYLIALTRDEVESLISQDDEILINLREPVAEFDDENLFTPKPEASEINTPIEKPLTTSEIHWAPSFEDKAINLKEEETLPEPEPIKNSNVFSDINLKEEAAFNPIDDLKINEEPKPAEPQKDFSFDESAFLNEDGIPKAEFEIPDEPVQKENKFIKTDDDLNDALFNILSGNADPKFDMKKTFEEPPAKEEDNAFFESLALNEEPVPVKETSSKFEIQPEEELPKEETNFQIPIEDEIPAAEQPASLNFQPAEIQEDFLEKTEDKKEQIAPAEIDASPPTSQQIPNFNQREGAMDADELKMIIKAAELVNSDIRVDEVLKNIVNVAKDITHADRGTLYLVDKEKMELWSLVTLGDEMREIRLKIGEGLAGFVAKSGETINIKDVRTDSRFNPEFDRQSGYTTKNMICFPIRNNKGEIIGVLQLLNNEKGEFTKRDEEFLTALSIHSAMALNNAELVEKLLQGERVQSLGKMANFLIQDIKKPVLVSKRYAEHLKSKQLPPETLQILDMLLDQLSQVADLVQTTSSYSEGKTILRTLNVSLNNTLTDYAARMEQFCAGKNCKMLSEFDKDVTVKLDSKEFFQSYQHIVKNACDAMPDGGKITVSTKRGDKKVEIFIQDTGLGIPEGLKEKIFEPFMSHGKKEGTGLGLSITRKIIEAHNGTITAVSSLGEGATFIITLPLAQPF